MFQKYQDLSQNWKSGTFRKENLLKKDIPFENLRYSNTSKEESTIVKKKAGKGSCVFMWDRMDYILEANKQLNNITICNSKTFDISCWEQQQNVFGLKAKGLINQKKVGVTLYALFIACYKIMLWLALKL